MGVEERAALLEKLEHELAELASTGTARELAVTLQAIRIVRQGSAHNVQPPSPLRRLDAWGLAIIPPAAGVPPAAALSTRKRLQSFAPLRLVTTKRSEGGNADVEDR